MNDDRVFDVEAAILGEFVVERDRAHLKHGKTSMESKGAYEHRRHTILSEEVGEVATELNDIDHADADADLIALHQHKLRKELVQCGAMVLSWIAAIDGAPL